MDARVLTGINKLFSIQACDVGRDVMSGIESADLNYGLGCLLNLPLDFTAISYGKKKKKKNNSRI